MNESELRLIIDEVVDELLRRAASPTKYPPNHGRPWLGSTEDKLLYDFSAFTDNEARKFGRARDAVRIKLLRILRREYPTDWMVAQKGE